MRIIKVIITFFMTTICFVLCSVAFAFWLETFEKSVEFGKEFIGMEYSTVIHQYGKEPDVIEKMPMNKLDMEFKNAYGSFIDTCNVKNQVIKFTYKNVMKDITLWAYDNNNSVKIILTR